MKYYKKMFLLKEFLRKVLSLYFDLLITLFRMDIYGKFTGQKGPPLPKICHSYPTMMKLGAVIPYLKKIQKRNK